MQDQFIIAIRLISDAESKIKNFKYNHCWHSCNLNGTFCDCGNQFDQQLHGHNHQSKDNSNKYEDSLIVNKKTNEDTKIGVVTISVSKYDNTLKDFRKLMENQIEELPPSFIFLFNNGYPVSHNQEKVIKLKHIASTDGIIDIKRKFNLTRCGIMSVCGEIFGFVFLDPTLSVVSIRDIIVKDLNEIHSFKSIQNNFIFCDRNGWPMNSEQEFHLIGYDIVSDNMIKIRPFKIETKMMSSSELDFNTGVKTLNLEKNESTITLYDDCHVDGSTTNNNSNNSNNSEEERQNHKNQDDVQQNVLSTNNSQIRHTNHSNSNSNTSTGHYHPAHYINNQPDVLSTLNNIHSLNDSFYKHNLINDQTLIKSQSVRHKPILISYVRREAEQHARNLKTQLTSLGCDVYLDVDEIKVGMDWQDALNEAVKSCEIFIPLVTPNYGLTLWTNRECKYADMQEKFILPVNFLRQWPPECLAIQFATTQFLPWKTKDEFEEDLARVNDITHWEDRHVIRTAQQISEMIKRRSSERTYLTDELSIHEHNGTGDEDNTTDELQINSLDNSIDGNEKKEDLLKNGDPISIEEVDSRTPSIEEDNALVKVDQIDDQLTKMPFASFAALSSFGSMPVFKKQVSSPDPTSSSAHTKKSPNPSFTENVINSLTIKSCKRANCESIKFTKRIFQKPRDKNLIAISAHPAQRSVVDSLKAKLSPHYNVWSSTDMIQPYTYKTNDSSANYLECKDELNKSDQLSTSFNSLSSSVNSIETDRDMDDSTQASVQNFSQIVSQESCNDSLHSGNYDTMRSVDINTFNQTVSCHRVEKQSSRFDKCFYRNNIAKSIGKSQWYVDSAEMNSQSCILQPDEIDKMNIFKEKVNEARIVILLLSEDYCDSRTSKRQAFYCDFRKPVLPVNLEYAKNESHWVDKLMGNPYLIKKSDYESEIEMIDKVCHRICNIIKSEEKLNCQQNEKKIEEYAEYIQKKFTVYNKDKLYVYVLGSTKFENQSTKELCEKIGRCLAKKEKIILVTGGAYGVADTVAQSFYEERKRIREDNRKLSINQLSNQNDKSVVLHCDLKSDDKKIDINSLDVLHILPTGQVGDFKYKYSTKEDGTFKPLPYGHTVFLSETVEDRDCVVSRAFAYSILIGGGKRSAKQAQDFIYNENIVIPVCNTGGAAAGHFISDSDCGNNITAIPAGVNEDDWVNLNKRDLPICELGQTIFNIIDDLSKYHLSNVRCKLFDTINKKIYGKKKTHHKKLSDGFSPLSNSFNQTFKIEDDAFIEQFFSDERAEEM